METTSASDLRRCVASFESLLSHTQLWGEPSSIPLELLQNELGRLKVWTANVGTDSTGISSLEFRLRRAVDVDTQVKYTASSLDIALHDLQMVLNPSLDDSAHGDTMTPVEKDEELMDIYLTVEACIDALYHMTYTIMQPGGPRDSPRTIDETKKPDTRVQQVVGQLKDQFPICDPLIQQRLEYALHRRLNDLNYLQSRNVKVEDTREDAFGHDFSAGESSTGIHSSSLETMQRPSIFRPPDLTSTSLKLQETRAEEGSAVSSLPVNAPRIGLPPTPRFIPGRPVPQCPYCLMPIVVKSMQEWIRHLHRDIMPYMCVFLDCSIPGRLYGQRRHLFHHFEAEHTQDLAKLNCPLCREDQSDSSNLKLHIARHLKHMALSMLPPINAEGSEVALEEYPDFESESESTDTDLKEDYEREAMRSAWSSATPGQAPISETTDTDLGTTGTSLETADTDLEEVLKNLAMPSAWSSAAFKRTPAAFPFFFRIKHVRYVEHPITPSLPQAPQFRWKPSSSDRFIVERSSGCWIWDPGEIQSQDQLHRLRRPTGQEFHRYQRYSSCTMIWDPESHSYIQIPIDCSTVNVSSSSHTWRQLSFGWNDSPQRAHIALISHNQERSRLHLLGPDHWFEQLLPNVCQGRVNIPRRCALAGDLSILAGLVAFSARPEYDRWAVDRSFRCDVRSTLFKPNMLPKSSKNQRRAMVIEIGYDPTVVTWEQLRAWEQGHYGEIFS